LKMVDTSDQTFIRFSLRLVRKGSELHCAGVATRVCRISMNHDECHLSCDG
jgi:hypothetical protein